MSEKPKITNVFFRVENFNLKSIPLITKGIVSHGGSLVPLGGGKLMAVEVEN